MLVGRYIEGHSEERVVECGAGGRGQGAGQSGCVSVAILLISKSNGDNLALMPPPLAGRVADPLRPYPYDGLLFEVKE